MIEDITLELVGVADPHLRSQEPISVSGRVPDKCPDLSFSVLEIERSVNLVGDITLKPLGVVDLHLISQGHPLMSGRVPDKCPDLPF